MWFLLVIFGHYGSIVILNQEIRIFPLIPKLIYFDEKGFSLIMGVGLRQGGGNVQEKYRADCKGYQIALIVECISCLMGFPKDSPSFFKKCTSFLKCRAPWRSISAEGKLCPCRGKSCDLKVKCT